MRLRSTCSRGEAHNTVNNMVVQKLVKKGSEKKENEQRSICARA